MSYNGGRRYAWTSLDAWRILAMRGRGNQSWEIGRRGCYKATVNEPETITVAQPLDRMRRSPAGRAPRPLSNGAELGSVRKCRIALRSGTGDSARPQFPDPGAFLPV